MEDRKIERDLCRCCHNEGSFRALSDLCSIGGEEGYYSDMLRLTLSIELQPISGLLESHTYTICDECVLRLKDATSFRQQVMQCEERFQEMHKKGVFTYEPRTSEKIHIEEKNIIKVSTKDKRTIKSKSPKISLLEKQESILLKNLENIREMFKNSNATPIKYSPGVRYSCCFCIDKFPNPKDLKLHIINDHDMKTKLKFMKYRFKPTFTVKMDITGLKCTICDLNTKNVDRLMKHLLKSHQKQVHVGATNYIVPFKFDSDELNCAICNKTASTFKVLVQHMNKHYKNFVCDQCDAGFVNQNLLRDHSYRHVRGEFTCPQCSKIFDTQIKMKAHERAVHVLLNRRSKCSFCGERFPNYNKKNQHEVEFHGAVAQVLRCQACPRTFSSQRSLSMHTKNFHLKEKRKSKSS